MTEIYFVPASLAVTALWIFSRAAVWIKNRKINLKREAELLLVYICIMVIFRITFFHLEKIDGNVQPLVIDAANIFNFRINLVPFVNLFDYESLRDALINFIGNAAMFIPVGIIWPIVFKELDTHKKAIAAGIGFSLVIEILQLPIYDRVSDIDDLILNSIGFLAGYGIYLLVKKLRRK